MERTKGASLSASPVDASTGHDMSETPCAPLGSLSALPEISVNSHTQDCSRLLHSMLYLVRETIRRCGRAGNNSLAAMGDSRVRRTPSGICKHWCSAMGTVLCQSCHM